MRLFATGLLLIALPALAAAQQVVVSPRPDKVAVTVYRDPHGRGAMELSWLNGFALVSETRHVILPAGESELRFEGVAGGLIPQSAVIGGLGTAVTEKNRDAKLLSPGTLIDAYLGQRVHLRRTSKATGMVVEQEAVIRASGQGVVVQTDQGIEALRCTGLSETLLAPSVPAALSAKPTLSVRARAERPIEADVTLTYLTSDFDWRAHYVATLASDGRTLSLFAWLTLANGDETGFANADTMVVAGRLNREYAERLQPEYRPIAIECWPSGTTSDGLVEDGGYGIPPPPPPPPPPPAAMPERSESIVVTGSRIMAQREDLGDLKLYQIPIPVTVAAHSQKQVALLEQPTAKFADLFRWDTSFEDSNDEPESARRLLKLDNRKADGLGLPLPAGSFTLYAMRDGRPFLLGEGRMTDRAVGEMVEVELADSPGVRVLQRQAERNGKDFETSVTVTNDQAIPARFEARFGDETKPLGGAVKRRDGYWVWDVVLPANSSRTMTLRYRPD
jgi:hypothetical protein